MIDKARSTDPRHPVRRYGPFLILSLLVVMWGWLTRADWLPSMVTYLDVSEPPEHVDVVVSLGSNMGRVAKAAQLFEQGLASEIVISGRPSYLEEQIAFLEGRGVARDRIRTVVLARNTWTEAGRVMALLNEGGARSAMIVTNDYHTRRARATYERRQTESYVPLVFVAADRRVRPDAWWKKPGVRWMILREYAKLGFYLVRYGVVPF